MTRALGLLLLFATSGCAFTAWDVGGPWACDAGQCAEGYVCDDGVCCKPSGSPACPTLASPDGTCPLGSMPDYFFRDADGDGAGARASRRGFCSQPQREAWVRNGDDCNDDERAIGPFAAELCNAIDDDCDDVVDDGLGDLFTWYRDQDGDSFGGDCAGCSLKACAQPPGYVPRAGDCDDGNSKVFPGAREACNNVDDNCNGQRDDPPFTDAEPRVAGLPAFTCQSGLPGECATGSDQCLFTGAQFEHVCVYTPSVDVCDGKDNDCNGAIDDRPGCGGPAALLSDPGVTIGALSLYGNGLPSLPPLPSGCVKNVTTGAEGMAWLNPSWIGTGDGLHVWYAEAPPGKWWDLTSVSTLRLQLYFGYVGSPDGGVWDTPRFKNPVIQLCGLSDTDYVRYSPNLPQSELFASANNHTFLVGLKPGQGDGGWSPQVGGAFDFTKVRRVEVLASPRAAVTFTNRFTTDAGVLGFE